MDVWEWRQLLPAHVGRRSAAAARARPLVRRRARGRERRHRAARGPELGGAARALRAAAEDGGRVALSGVARGGDSPRRPAGVTAAQSATGLRGAGRTRVRWLTAGRLWGSGPPAPTGAALDYLAATRAGSEQGPTSRSWRRERRGSAPGALLGGLRSGNARRIGPTVNSTVWERSRASAGGLRRPAHGRFSLRGSAVGRLPWYAGGQPTRTTPRCGRGAAPVAGVRGPPGRAPASVPCLLGSCRERGRLPALRAHARAGARTRQSTVRRGRSRALDAGGRIAAGASGVPRTSRASACAGPAAYRYTDAATSTTPVWVHARRVLAAAQLAASRSRWLSSAP
jgi:hypothetical protein